jgi:hypothetical protein
VTPVISANCTLPNAGGVTPAGATPSVQDVPKYYVAVVACGDKPSQSGLVVGDTFTGKVVATVAPPAGMSFLSVSAAADDRTFAVFAAPPGAGPAVAGWWYLLRLAPGTSSPARLTRIPVKPLSDVAETELSGSGQELAVGRALNEAGQPWLGVYSVATGRLLRSWSSRTEPPFRIEGWGVFPGTPGNPQNSSLTWAEDGKAILFWAVASGGAADLRQLDIAGNGSDIVKDSHVIWSTAAHRECIDPQLSADAKTAICPVPGSQISGKGNWTERWLAYSVTTPAAAPVVRYQMPDNAELAVSTPWAGPSGAIMLLEVMQITRQALKVLRFGLVSHGAFTPLKPPAMRSGVMSMRPLIAW